MSDNGPTSLPGSAGARGSQASHEWSVGTGGNERAPIAFNRFSWRPVLLALSVYVALAAVQGNLVIRHATDHLPSDAGDPLLNVSVLAWNSKHVPLSEDWWNFAGFYPTRSTLTFSEHLTGLSVIATPLLWSLRDPVLVYNLLFLSSFALCAVSAYALAYSLTGNTLAAFLAGLVFGFAPYRAAHLAHIQLLSSYWMPAALLALHLYLQKRCARWLVLFAIAWLLQALVNSYYLIYFSVLIVLWMVWFLVLPRKGRQLLAVASAMLVASLALTPIVFRYVAVHQALGLSRDFREIQIFSADVLALLSAPSVLSTWGWLKVVDGPEGELFPGLTLTILLTIGAVMSLATIERHDLARWRRILRVSLSVGALTSALAAVSVLMFGPWRLESSVFRISATGINKPISLALALFLAAVCLGSWFRRAVRESSPMAFYSIAAVLTWLLSLGPRPTLLGHPILYEAPYSWLLTLPGVDGIRAPARFWMITVLCLAMVAAMLFARVAPRLRGRHTLVAALIAAGLVIDSWMIVPAAPVPTLASPIDGYVADSNVLEVPLGDVYSDTAAQYRAVMGNWSTFNGYSGYRPPHYGALERALDTRTDGVLDVLRAFGTLTVVVNPANDPTGEWTRFIARQPDATRLAIRDMTMFRFPSRPTTSAARPGPQIPIRSVVASCQSEMAASMFDGDITSRWDCGPQTADQQVVIELQRSRVVSSVTQILGPFTGDFPISLHVETSVDGHSWESAWNGPGVILALIGSLADAARVPLRTAFDPRTARFIRLRQDGKDFHEWSILELAVYAPAPDR
jgi:hypothetical protein